MRRISILLALALVVPACDAIASSMAASAFYGTWKVTKINTYTHITESEKKIKALVGTAVVLSATEVVEAGEQVCPVTADSVTVETVDSAREIASQEGITATEAGLPSKVYKIDYGCIQFYKVGNHLVFSDRGAYYTAEHIK